MNKPVVDAMFRSVLYGDPWPYAALYARARRAGDDSDREAIVRRRLAQREMRGRVRRMGQTAADHAFRLVMDVMEGNA